MANLYYNAAVDTAWDTLGNWWENAGHNTPAAAIPANGDTVYLSGAMTSGPSTSVTLANINVLIDSVNFTGAIGNATFNGTSQNSSGTITGDATFNDTSYNGSQVQGNATFNHYSFNNNNFASVFGDTATFNDYSYNAGDGGLFTSGIVINNSIFNDYSYNNGITSFSSGIATFNDSSYNNITGSSGNGSYIFNDDSSNLRTENTNKTATFNGPYAEGRIADNSSYGDLTINMTAPSGGGSDNTIARLLDLPWFINL